MMRTKLTVDRLGLLVPEAGPEGLQGTVLLDAATLADVLARCRALLQAMRRDHDAALAAAEGAGPEPALLATQQALDAASRGGAKATGACLLAGRRGGQERFEAERRLEAARHSFRLAKEEAQRHVVARREREQAVAAWRQRATVLTEQIERAEQELARFS